MARNKSQSTRHQIQVDPYTRHVLDKLVGVKGRNRSDVAYFVFRQWISDHWEELAGYGIKAQISDGEYRQ
jgi:hypothetical protein